MAAGYLTGKHNVNLFTVSRLDGYPLFQVRGNCDGCLLMPGASRETDLVFISLTTIPWSNWNGMPIWRVK
jgi:hypothetical protein